MCNNAGRKLTTLPVQPTLPVQRLHLFATLLIGAGILAMGADNSHQLARCEATGRNQAQCRLLVLGR